MDVAHDLDLIAEADDRLFASLAGLADSQAREPSALPGWSRGHLLTHLARNADGLINLLSWARTGVVTPMYREPDGRDADIEAGSSRPAAELVADLRDASARWHAVAAALPATAWTAEVRRRPHLAPEPASNLLNGRLFEVEFHHVDVALGYRFTESPAEVVQRALADTHRRLRPAEPFVAIVAGSADRLVFPADSLAGEGAIEVHGEAAELLGWLTGRSAGHELSVTGTALPALPAW